MNFLKQAKEQLRVSAAADFETWYPFNFDILDDDHEDDEELDTDEDTDENVFYNSGKNISAYDATQRQKGYFSFHWIDTRRRH